MINIEYGLPEALKSLAETIIRGYTQEYDNKIYYVFCGSSALNLFLLAGNYYPLSEEEPIIIKPRPDLLRKIGDLDYIVDINAKHPRISVEMKRLSDLERMVIKSSDKICSLKSDAIIDDLNNIGYVKLGEQKYYILDIKRVLAEKALASVTKLEQKHKDDLKRVWPIVQEVYANDEDFESALLERMSVTMRDDFEINEESLIYPHINRMLSRYPAHLVSDKNRLVLIRALNAYGNNASHLIDLLSEISFKETPLTEQKLIGLAMYKDFSYLSEIIRTQHKSKNAVVGVINDIKSSTKSDEIQNLTLSLLNSKELSDEVIEYVDSYFLWGDIPTLKMNVELKNSLQPCLGEEDYGFSKITDNKGFLKIICC